MIRLTKDTFQPFLHVLNTEPVSMVEEASCVTIDLNSAISLIFKARDKECITIRVQQYQYIDWSRYEATVREVISMIECYAVELGCKEVELEANRRNALLKIFVQCGYNNRYGGKRGNGLEGRYVKVLMH
ncbi:hypothetical protein [Halalkalibacterium ligniniphilum]|uniref:hypothetical protein n=1 Tax=Halalkalibacterium ligniniphilum TaxID=1134413 RepID=UPI0003460CB6|nr:hypothetical protein [Halalkalibacterium ligniniphilum]